MLFADVVHREARLVYCSRCSAEQAAAASQEAHNTIDRDWLEH